MTKGGQIRDIGDLSWQKEGHCRKTNMDPDLFFPEAGITPGRGPRQPPELRSLYGGNITPEAKAAVDACRVCSVQKTCFEYGLADRQSAGILGGSTEADRKRIRAERSSNRKLARERSQREQGQQQGQEAHEQPKGAQEDAEDDPPGGEGATRGTSGLSIRRIPGFHR